jgi:hypothetical protein
MQHFFYTNINKMKKTIVFLLLIFGSKAHGQADLNTHNVVKDSIVAKYNRQDFKGIYAMSKKGFKADVSENDLTAFLKSFSILGKISSSSLLNQGKKATIKKNIPFIIY